MPLRDFECQRCRERFEALIRHPEEEAELECPKCRARKVRRLLSAPAAVGKSGGGGASCGGGRAGFT